MIPTAASTPTKRVARSMVNFKWALTELQTELKKGNIYFGSEWNFLFAPFRDNLSQFLVSNSRSI